MSERPPSPHAFRVADLPRQQKRNFELQPDAAVMREVAVQLDLLALRKLSFKGLIIAAGDADWRLDAHLGATVVQPCGISLDPVTTRLETDVTRLYQHDFVDVDVPEAEMPEDDTTEPLGRWIDPEAVMIEALALALPLYPRKESAALGETVYAEPGVVPMRDEDTRPFAGLAALKDAMNADVDDGKDDK